MVLYTKNDVFCAFQTLLLLFIIIDHPWHKNVEIFQIRKQEQINILE